MDVDKLLTEELGVYNGQYELAKTLTQKALESLTDGIQVFEYQTDGRFSFNKVICNVEFSHVQTSAMIYNFDEECNLYIRLFVYNKLSHYTRTQLTNAIAHELMHGHIFTKRYSQKVEINDMPFLYNVSVEAIQNQGKNILYYFCYGIYSTYYQEVQSFVSQAKGEIFDLLGYNADVKVAIQKSNSYQIYYENIKVAEKIIDMEDDSIQEIICSYFDKRGYLLTPKTVRKLCRTITKISRKALKDICRVAVIAQREKFF